MTGPRTTAAAWQSELDVLAGIVEGLRELAQSVQIILTTPTGSVPHRPDFGCDLWEWLDQPIAIARANVVQEVVTAIAKFEPRVRVVEVLVTPSEEEPISGFHLRVVVAPIGDTDELALVLALPSGELLEATVL